jgi:hypothetical protein
MSPALMKITKRSSLREVSSDQFKIKNLKLETGADPVVNRGFKGLLSVFKTFLLVGGDLV